MPADPAPIAKPYTARAKRLKKTPKIAPGGQAPKRFPSAPAFMKPKVQPTGGVQAPSPKRRFKPRAG